MTTSLPWPLELAVTVVVSAFLVWVGYRLGSAQSRVDRILAEELYHPLVSDEEAADRAEREGGHA